MKKLSRKGYGPSSPQRGQYSPLRALALFMILIALPASLAKPCPRGDASPVALVAGTPPVSRAIAEPRNQTEECAIFPPWGHRANRPSPHRPIAPLSLV
jgi:hypothetical protein